MKILKLINEKTFKPFSLVIETKDEFEHLLGMFQLPSEGCEKDEADDFNEDIDDNFHKVLKDYAKEEGII